MKKIDKDEEAQNKILAELNKNCDDVKSAILVVVEMEDSLQTAGANCKKANKLNPHDCFEFVNPLTMKFQKTAEELAEFEKKVKVWNKQ